MAESLGAAESCRRDGLYADSISRTYYVILHAAKAALQLRDIASESHAAVKRLFGLHLVHTPSGSLHRHRPGCSVDSRLRRRDQLFRYGRPRGIRQGKSVLEAHSRPAVYQRFHSRGTSRGGFGKLTWQRGFIPDYFFPTGFRIGGLGSRFLTLYNLKDRRSLILFGGLKYENGNRGRD